MLRHTLLLVAVAAVLFSYVSAEEEENDDRVVGGRTAFITEYPYQVSFLRDGTHFCGGSVISNSHILTAAHCLSGLENIIPQLDVVLGSTTWGSGGVRRKIATFRCHSSWTQQLMDSDVCLVKLQSPVVFSASIKPIALSSVNPPDGVPLVLSGFGWTRDKEFMVSPILKAVQLESISQRRCAGPGFAYGPQAITSNMICGYGRGEGSCQGDSGGPLVDLRTNQQVGVVSWGAVCAAPHHPGVYASVANLKPWIENTMRMLR